jgi:hypothetical protein
MTMPEAPMHLDGRAIPWKHNIGPSRKLSIVESKSYAKAVQCAADFQQNPKGLLLGWATAPSINTWGEKTWPGKVSDNGRFTFKSQDWDVAISKLYLPSLLLPCLQGELQLHPV